MKFKTSGNKLPRHSIIVHNNFSPFLSVENTSPTFNVFYRFHFFVILSIKILYLLLFTSEYTKNPPKKMKATAQKYTVIHPKTPKK